MEIKFENTSVPIWKLRKGTVVSFNGDFWHIESFYRATDGRLILAITNHWEETECNPRHIEWLEPI